MSEPGLPLSFYNIPQASRTTMATKELRAVLLATDGRILACGEMWDIVARHMAAGVYEVTLSRSVLPTDLPAEEA